MTTTMPCSDSVSVSPEGDVLVVATSSSTEAVLEEGEMQPSTQKSRDVEEQQQQPPNLPLVTNHSIDTSKEAENDSDWQLTENVYSLMYTCRAGSPAFLFGLFVFIFQMTIIALMLWDLFDHYTRSKNPFNVPPGVTPQVKAAQILALLLAVATQDDVICSVVLLQRGYDESVLQLSPYATRQKWFVSSILQLLAGSGYLMTIFVLVVQSDSVIAMMLNFAALSFVSEIDDVAFSLASKGFLSNELEREALLVQHLRIPASQQKQSKTLRCILFFTIYAGLMTGYTVIVQQQEQGRFLCQKLLLQFGDGFAPEASTFSGIYDQTNQLVHGRVTYIERRSKQAMLGYCHENNAWTLTRWMENDTEEETHDPCKWFYKSPMTDSFDITTTSDTTWIINVDNLGGMDQFQSFVLSCVDCDSTSGTCSGKGHCQDNECVCDQDWYGPTCRFSEPCPTLAVDARTSPFSFQYDSNYTFANEYSLLTNKDNPNNIVSVYEKPVYAYHHGSFWSLMLFLGRRWIVTSTALFEDWDQDMIPIPPNATRQELVKSLHNFHGFFTPLPAFFVSDPMDVGTPSDALSPVGLGWYHTKVNSLEGVLTRLIDTSHPLDTVMLCTVCHTYENDCFFGAECVNGTCNCDASSHDGSLCELEVDGSQAQR